MAFHKKLGLLSRPAYFKRDEKLSPRHSWWLKARWLAFQEQCVKPRWHRSIWVREFCQPKCPEQFQIRGGEAARRCSLPLNSRRVLPPRLLHFSRNWSDAELRPGPVDWMHAASIFVIFFKHKSSSVCVFSKLALDLDVWMMINKCQVIALFQDSE